VTASSLDGVLPRPPEPRELTEEESVLARKLEARLSELRTGTVVPVIERNRRTGTRFDMRSAMRSEHDPDERPFRKTVWTPTDPSTLNVVLATDYSWSTSFVLDRAVSTVAVLVSALERTGHRSAALFFAAEEPRLVKGWSDPTLPNPDFTRAWRYTRFAPALALVSEVFRTAPDGTRLLIVLSDGELTDEPDGLLTRRWTEAFRESGGHSLGLSFRDYRPLGLDVEKRLGSVDELVPVVGSYLASVEEEVR
jgi:hypothetical protein